MNPATTPGENSQPEMMATLFAQLVMQQTNMALMLLGKIANPTNGETMHDPEAARFFIDQLEMLEFKTRGNLGPEEQKLIKQSLMSLRMAFIEVVNQSPTAPGADTSADAAGKRFSKKY